MESLLYLAIETCFIVFVYLFVILSFSADALLLTEVFVPSGSELRSGVSPILFVALIHAVTARTRRSN